MRALLLSLMAWLLLAHTAQAESLNVNALGALPILHEGRIKPIERFAQLELRRMHKAEQLPNMNATEWLAQALFRPDLAIHQPVFAIADDTLVSFLNLTERESGFYAYSEVTPALEKHKALLTRLANKDANSYSATERRIWQLYEAVDAMTQITGSLSLLLPQKIETNDKLRDWMQQSKQSRWRYIDVANMLNPLENEVKRIAKKKGDDVSRYSDWEQRLLMLSYRYASLHSIGRDNHLLRVIPSDWSEEPEWFSPWEIINDGKGSPSTAKLFASWQGLMDAYHAGDQAQWLQSIAALNASMQSQEMVSSWDLVLEQLYYDAHLIELSMLGYVAALLLACYALSKPHLRAARMACHVLGASVVLHAAAIIIRILVLGRPPIGTLYESVLFVAFIAALLGLWLAKRKAYPEGMVIGAGLGAFLLSISGLYLGEGEDGMGVLVAVLNTNFWLATHVVCITIGYGATLIAGLAGHVALIAPDKSRHSALLMLTIIALLFTTVGTILGGIWADQSWGRFWGWDPKENGALLIVLWLVWLLHGKWAGKLGRYGFAALLSCSTIIVALSWFGVNLLNVGLHSYGFTEEAAFGLAAFCAIEVALISVLYMRTRSLRKRQTA
ncbi:MAG: cytochrome c biogenesis protein CcsA [Rickettsiales bacterium]|nr:cytochrome c biogenesis protein CcsA [Rickettsiales bacterium]